MLLDYYLIPLVEISFSIVLPLILTLKALQVVTSPSTTTESAQAIPQVLIFWLNYWLVLYFIELAGVNKHFTALFSFYYLTRSHVVLISLLKFYRLTLLPFTTRNILKLVKVELTEDELDEFLGTLLNKVCFDSKSITTLFSFLYKNEGPSLTSLMATKPNIGSLLINKGIHTGSNHKHNNGHTTSTRHTSVNNPPYPSSDDLLTVENIIPLEISQPRSTFKGGDTNTHLPNQQTTPRNRSTSIGTRVVSEPNMLHIPKRSPSKQNLRPRNISGESISKPDHLNDVFVRSSDLVYDTPNDIHSKRVVTDERQYVTNDYNASISRQEYEELSNDMTLKEKRDSRSFKAGIKNIFITN